MKRFFFTLAFLAAATWSVAQDLGITAYSDNRFPLSKIYPTPALFGYGADLAWSNPDKGFPVFGLISIGFHTAVPQKIETVSYGVNKSADIMAHEAGYRIRYCWEVVQPMQHLSVLFGVGSSFYRLRIEAKTDAPLSAYEYVQDSRGFSYSYGSNEERFMGIAVEGFGMVMYELPVLNVWAQLGYSVNGTGYDLPYGKAVFFSAGAFVPLIRH